ncbi:hypothetical protein ACX6XY_19935 [Streptomyces sp. O3]
MTAAPELVTAGRAQVRFAFCKRTDAVGEAISRLSKLRNQTHRHRP